MCTVAINCPIRQRQDLLETPEDIRGSRLVKRELKRRPAGRVNRNVDER